MPAPSPWPASFTATSDTVTLTVAARGLAADRVAEVWFYPARWGAIEHAAPQRVSIGADAVTLAVARGPLPEAVAAPIDGVLVVAERLDGAVSRQAFTVRAEPRAPATGGARALAASRALALALAGGVVLNLMPCVLPVLSMKALRPRAARQRAAPPRSAATASRTPRVSSRRSPSSPACCSRCAPAASSWAGASSSSRRSFVTLLASCSSRSR